MPRYYFNVFNSVRVIDDEGVELRDVAAARQEAFKSAAAMIGEQIAEGGKIDPSHRIEVLDENRDPVFKLRFGDLMGSE